jgi:predicted transcriptional regulator
MTEKRKELIREYVLDFIKISEKPVSVNEITEAYGYNRRTVLRALNHFRQEGYIKIAVPGTGGNPVHYYTYCFSPVVTAKRFVNVPIISFKHKQGPFQYLLDR